MKEEGGPVWWKAGSMEARGAVGTVRRVAAEEEEAEETEAEVLVEEGKTSLARPEDGPGEGAGEVPPEAK